MQPSFGLTSLKRKPRLTSATLLENLIFLPAFTAHSSSSEDFSSRRTCFLKSRVQHIAHMFVLSFVSSFVCVRMMCICIKIYVYKGTRGNVRFTRRTEIFLPLLLLLLIGSCCIFYPVCSPVMSMSNFRSNLLETVSDIQETWRCLVPHFLRFCWFCLPVIIHPVCTISPCSSPDFACLMTSWISQMLRMSSLQILQSIASDAP